jgi:hypothetical protein
MQPDLEGKMPTRATIARSGRFASPRQTLVRRDLAPCRKAVSTVHGVVFAFFVVRASVTEPFAG